MKVKRSGLFIIGLVLSIFLISVVSAQSNFATSANNVIEGFVDAIEPFAKYVLGSSAGIGDFSAGEILFAKILFFMILLGVIWTALEKVDFFSETAWMHWIVSIGVSILAIRFLGNSLVPMLILPYSVLGVAIAAGFPFVVYFIIVEMGMVGNKNKTFRKIAWGFFAVIFVVLWSLRNESLGDAGWIYILTALISLLMLAMDGTIQRIFAKMKLEKNLSVSDHLRYTKLIEELEKLENARVLAIKEGKEVKSLNQQIGHIKGELVKLTK